MDARPKAMHTCLVPETSLDCAMLIMYALLLVRCAASQIFALCCMSVFNTLFVEVLTVPSECSY